MNSVEFIESGLTRQYASKVAELEPDQYLEFCRLFCEYTSGKLNLDEFMMGTIYSALRMVPSMQITSKENHMQLAYNIEKLIGTLGGFWKEVEHEGEKIDVIDWSFTDQKLPIIRAGKTLMFGPAEGLSDLTYGEYDSAHRNFNLFVRTQEETYLNTLVGVLYRPASGLWSMFTYKKNIQRKHRKKLKDMDDEAHLQLISKLPYYVRFAAFKWWSNMEDFIRKAQIPTESGYADLSELFESDDDKVETGIIDATGNRGVLYSLAESAVFGNVEKTEETLFWDVMLRIYHLKKSSDRQKEYYEKMKDDSTRK